MSALEVMTVMILENYLDFAMGVLLHLYTVWVDSSYGSETFLIYTCYVHT